MDKKTVIEKPEASAGERWGTVIGFFAAAFVPTACLAITSPLGDSLSPKGIVASGLLYFPFAMMAALLWGVPTYLMALKLRRVSWWSSAIGGCVGGLLVCAALGEGNFSWHLAVVGAAAGLSFWLCRWAGIRFIRA